MKPQHRNPRRRDVVLFAVLGIAMACFAFYIVHWYAERARIMEESAHYADLYARGDSPAPTDAPALDLPPAQTPVPEASPEPLPTPAASPEPTAGPAVETDAPEPSPTADPGPRALPTVRDIPIIPESTPDADTLLMLMPSSPPEQASFSELTRVNPDTVGYLEIPGLLSLPVVQRLNDNEFYLTHSFEGAEAAEGALFMDGSNRLVPEDDCLIVYGHNMRNDTMFGQLDRYESVDFLREHPLARFDTIYENRVYVPFAVFSASVEPGNRHYFDVRQFLFDDVGFDLFTLKLQSRSVYDIPVDVTFGDRLLLLVTCEYTNENGRLILALRQLRSDETEQAMEALVGRAAEKAAR